MCTILNNSIASTLLSPMPILWVSSAYLLEDNCVLAILDEKEGNVKVIHFGPEKKVVTI